MQYYSVEGIISRKNYWVLYKQYSKKMLHYFASTITLVPLCSVWSVNMQCSLIWAPWSSLTQYTHSQESPWWLAGNRHFRTVHFIGSNLCIFLLFKDFGKSYNPFHIYESYYNAKCWFTCNTLVTLQVCLQELPGCTAGAWIAPPSILLATHPRAAAWLGLLDSTCLTCNQKANS